MKFSQPLGLRDSANVFLTIAYRAFICYFLMIISFYTTNNNNHKKPKESKTDLKVIAADIIDDTDWLYWLALVSHQEQLDTCPSFPDLYCSLTNIHCRTLLAVTQNRDFVRAVLCNYFWMTHRRNRFSQWMIRYAYGQRL